MISGLEALIEGAIPTSSLLIQLAAARLALMFKLEEEEKLAIDSLSPSVSEADSFILSIQEIFAMIPSS